MPTPLSTQSGSLTVNSGAVTSHDVTISSVTAANSIVMFTAQRSDATPRDNKMLFRGSLTNGTTLNFTRGAVSGTEAAIIKWSVVEFNSGDLQSLQAGLTDCTANPTDVTISAVTVAQALPFISYQTSQTGMVSGTDFPVPSLTSTTNLRFAFNGTPSAGQAKINWQVLEFKSADAGVQTGTITFQGGTPGTATITSINTAKSVVGSHTNGLNLSGERMQSRVDLNSATQVGATCQNFGSAVSGTARFHVLTMLDSSVVQSGRVDIADTATTPASQPSWTPALSSKAAVFSSSQRPNGYVNQAAESTPPDTNFSVVLDAGQLGATITRTGTTNKISLAWQIIDWVAAAAAGVTYPQLERGMRGGFRGMALGGA